MIDPTSIFFVCVCVLFEFRHILSAFIFGVLKVVYIIYVSLRTACVDYS